ncbi:hypothetical protein [Armatimonas sp.]
MATEPYTGQSREMRENAASRPTFSSTLHTRGIEEASDGIGRGEKGG